MSCCSFGGTVAARSVEIDGVTVERDGVLVGNFVVLNFEGNVSVTDEGDGTATILVGDNVYALPEVWWQDNVAANQVDVPLVGRVSTHFTTIKMMRAGSIVGLATRLTQPVTAGQMFVSITLNGVNVLDVQHTNALNVSGGVGTLPIGIETYAAGDLIGVWINTNAGFLPNTTDLETWVQLSERVV
jgi:hypothetical protein